MKVKFHRVGWFVCLLYKYHFRGAKKRNVTYVIKKSEYLSFNAFKMLL